MKSTLLPILVLLAAAIGGWQLGSGQARRAAGTARPAPIVLASPVTEMLSSLPVDARPAPNVPASPVQPHYNSKEEFLAAESKIAAAEWSAALVAAATPGRQNQLLKSLAHWAAVAPEEAWRAFQRDAHLLPSEDLKEPNLSYYSTSIMRNWADNHGWENARQGSSDAPEVWRASIRRALGSALKHQRGGGEILKGLMENSAPDQTEILAGVISEGGTDDFNPLTTPEECKNWLAKLPDPAEREIVAFTAFQKTRGADPKGSADWLYGLEGTPEQKGKRLQNIVFPWATSAPNACGEWLNTQHLGPEADEALDNFARAVVKSDPESAVAWAQRIQDPERRDEATLRSLSQWRRRSPTAAAAARERLGLTPPR